MLQVSQSGFPMDRRDLQSFIKSYLDLKGEVSRFANNKPGKEWVMSFERRHPEISRKKPELLTKARAEGLSCDVIKSFFEMYSKILRENNLSNHTKKLLVDNLPAAF